MSRLSVSIAALLFLAGAPARAQEQQSVKSLLGKGYDIKAVTFMRGEATENREAFLVTLQKEKSIAVCYMVAANWITLAPTALDDSKRCDVR
jgi:hypothetical protein